MRVCAQPEGAGAPGGLRRWGRTGWGSAHAVEVPPNATLLFTAGIVGTREDGSLPDSSAEQCERVFENLRLVLQEAGLGWDDCVKMMMYFTDGCDPGNDLQPARARAVGEGWTGCAATALGVRGIVGAPGAVVQVELIAAKCEPAAAL